MGGTEFQGDAGSAPLLEDVFSLWPHIWMEVDEGRKHRHAHSHLHLQAVEPRASTDISSPQVSVLGGQTGFELWLLGVKNPPPPFFFSSEDYYLLI